MTDLKLKTITVLDNYMILNLRNQEKISQDMSDEMKTTDFDKRKHKMYVELMSREKLTLEILLLFCNDTIGRVTTNKLCRKHKINNYSGGIPQ